MSDNVKNMEELAKLVRETRKAQGLTQDDLAGLSGTGTRFVSDLEKGKETAQIGKVLLILGALGLGLYTLSKWKK
ncbi:MAG: transcriptional regulator [Magnetococcales bacterium]|nr:transcriptional regulator [Magnetococcales bacterium]MEC8067125.1 type II toxin-antitoxin system Y4mF family antitoxin [Pseudomonadota bacterium]|tara:strand:+ start:717 stop:941 length:225 start_codon:yes stop_codon:yes gene_type:complete